MYPNPVVEQATVHFRSDKDGKVQVAIYNSVGTLVTTLYDATAEGGKDYTLSLSGDKLPSGVYFCRVVRNGKVENKRLTITK